MRKEGFTFKGEIAGKIKKICLHVLIKSSVLYFVRAYKSEYHKTTLETFSLL